MFESMFGVDNGAKHLAADVDRFGVTVGRAFKNHRLEDFAACILFRRLDPKLAIKTATRTLSEAFHDAFLIGITTPDAHFDFTDRAFGDHSEIELLADVV
jgi:hypothetical protein